MLLLRSLLRQSLKCKVKCKVKCELNLAKWSSIGASEGEKRITEILKNKFPHASTIAVTDISGGCGAMYEIIVESSEFQGIRTVLQHRLVHEALKEEIKAAHGVRIVTTVPQS
uniref:BolA-like protein 3 n=1 Tax=Strigamia maritima TaxID=126957 RepID=T1JGP7_STRMM